jgi:hypothetical protein
MCLSSTRRTRTTTTTKITTMTIPITRINLILSLPSQFGSFSSDTSNRQQTFTPRSAALNNKEYIMSSLLICCIDWVCGISSNTESAVSFATFLVEEQKFQLLVTAGKFVQNKSLVLLHDCTNNKRMTVSQRTVRSLN